MVTTLTTAIESNSGNPPMQWALGASSVGAVTEVQSVT